MNPLTSLFKPDSPHRTTLFLLAAACVAVAAATIAAFVFYPAPVFTWQQLQELQPQELPLYAFERGNLEFILSAENYVVFERWLGNAVQPNRLALDIYLSVVAFAIAGLLAVVSALPRFWFYIGALLAAFLFALLRWDMLLLFQNDSGWVAIGIVAVVLTLLFLFQFIFTSVDVGRRLVIFMAYFALLGWLVSTASTIASPLRTLAVNTLPPVLVLTLIFIILVAHQLMASFVALATASSKTHSLRQYLIISTIYLLNLWLAYWNRIGWLEWDYTIPAFVIFFLSAGLTVWTIRQRMPVYESIVRYEALLVYFILSLATLAMGAYGYFLAAGNDIALLSLNDLIYYTHLGYGLMFLVYVGSNFLGVFEKNLAVERVLYKPSFMPYFTYRFAGLIVTLAFVLYSNWMSHSSHFTSAYYTALGDVHYGQPTGKAHTFYARAHFYAPYNQYASTVLAALEWEAQNYGKQRNYVLDANKFQPTEFTLLNADQLYLSSGNAYAEIQWLRRAKNLFPSSGVIRNNLGLALARVGMEDSAAFYFREALGDSRTGKSAEINLLALLAKSEKPVNNDSIQQATVHAPTAIRSNALAVANHRGQPLAMVPEIPKDSLLDLFSASLLANYLTNQTNQADSTFVNTCVALARKAENLSFRHLILPAAAKSCYAAGRVNLAFQLLQETVFLGTQPANDNYTLGLMAMDQEKFDVAISYFLYALHHNSVPAALANAVCLAEEGRIGEAIIAWDTISQRGDTALHELGESMKRVLAAPPSWFEDLSETERLYYALYRIPLSDSSLFNRSVQQIRNEDLRAKAYLNRAREYYRIDDVQRAARQYTYLKGLHLTDTELFAEIKYFEMRMLAAEGRVEELWKIIDQGITFGPYHQSERFLYEGLKSWAAGDTATARRQLVWLAKNNWYFDEGVVTAALLHAGDLRTAYRLLSDALQVNPRSVRLLKAYIPVALGRGLDQYAADALETLRGLLPPPAFREYVRENDFSGLLTP